MPAREHETSHAETQVEDPMQVTTTESTAQFQAETEWPAPASMVTAAGVTASEIAFDGKEKQAPESAHLDKGMHYPEHYRAACEAAGKPEKWKDWYRHGHTEAKGWQQPYDHKRCDDFVLEKGHSASAAIQALLAGVTITDYRCAFLADEIDEVRSELGDIKFDKLFGSADKTHDATIPESQRLRVSSDLYDTPIDDQMRAIAERADAKPEVEDPVPTPAVETRLQDKPAETATIEQDPVVVAKELGVEQRDREMV
jgi:hypothetical protein